MKLIARERTTALTLAGLLILWEIAGRLHLVASGALPAPSGVLARLWVDRADYALHILATVRAASTIRRSALWMTGT